MPNDEIKKQSQKELKGVSLWKDAWRRLRKNKMAIFGGVVVILFILIAIFADVIAPYSYKQQDMPSQYLPPSFEKIITPNKVIEELSKSGVIDKRKVTQIINTIKEYERKELQSVLNCYRQKEANILIEKLIEKDFINKEDKEKANATIQSIRDSIPFPYILGTDHLGRDLLSRIIAGSRVSLAIGFVTALVSLFLGVTYGAISGFAGGKVDNLMMRFVDILYGIPFMFFVILLMVIFGGRNFYLLFIGIGAVSWMTLARITRGQIISLKNNEYIEAARSIGASNTRIIFKHLIPNAIGPIIVYTTLTIPEVMLSEAFLSFIGLGVQAPMTSWGLLASDGRNAIVPCPWLIIFPGLVLAIVLFSMNFLGEGLRDALDPSLKNKL